MSQAKQVLMACGVLLVLCVVVVVGTSFDDDASRASAWGCPPERIGHEIVDHFDRGGSPTRLEAARDWVALEAEDMGIDRSTLEAAFASTEGPTRYDETTGELFIGGLLMARWGIGQLSDGTWAAGSIQVCMRPPTA